MFQQTGIQVYLVAYQSIRDRELQSNDPPLAALHGGLGRRVWAKVAMFQGNGLQTRPAGRWWNALKITQMWLQHLSIMYTLES